MARDPFKIRCSVPQPKQPVFLTEHELQCITSRSQFLQRKKEEEEIRAAKLKAMKESSKELTKAIVNRKEAGSKLKKRQYEMEIQSAVREFEREAKMKARKNVVLNHAYKRLFEETDRVKNFKTAKNLAVALKERDDQIAAKASLKDEFEEYEARYLLGMLKDVEKYYDEQQEQMMKEKQNKLKNASNWTKQKDEASRKKSEEQWEILRDGLLIRSAAEEAEEEKLKQLREEKERIQIYKERLDEQIKAKRALLEVHQKLDAAEEQKAELFNEAKREMISEHKRVQEKMNKAKDSRRNRVAQTLTDQSVTLKAKEEAMLQKATMEAEKKYREASAIKEIELAEAQAAFKKFYEQEMAAKEKRKIDELLQGYQERRKIMELVEESEKLEDEKTRGRRDLEKEIQHLQMHQIEKRQCDRSAETLEDIKDYMNHMRSLDEEEEIFQKYADIEIKDCEVRGIDTYPMQKAARPGVECGKGPFYANRGSIRPKYYASVANPDELSHIKRPQDIQDTKSRLGFMLP
ncbi:coiled-coil domain-containing protein 173-like [Stegodyphus dumicola]|uniref:coiled-coil domain-containing protein 173-like n=1 Tax=Stegodyphus dumicola TaxID=202533 RepID=UPI0015AE973A|nr:coiled-coil domain-containing protein 173-like [Stegodyphus dumicola]